MRLILASLAVWILGVSLSPVNQVALSNARAPESFADAGLPPKLGTPVIGAVIRVHSTGQDKGCHAIDKSTAYEMPVGACHHFPGQNAEVLIQHCGILAIYQGHNCDGTRSALPMGECFDTVTWFSARVEKCGLI